MMKAVVILLLAFTGCLGALEGVQADSRIINGQPAADGAYPWQVSLQEPTSSGFWHFCGGSIISQNYVMTAAHCKKPAARVTVYAGSVDKFNGGERLEVASFIGHPDYNSRDYSMDYGIIQLVETLTLTGYINTIAIPGPEYNAQSKFVGNGITSGWGYVTYNGQYGELTDLLQVANVPVLDDEECEGFWGSFYQSSSMICAGANSEGTCMGDSGGPLVLVINGQNTLIGATSWGSSSCDTTLPSVWAKLSSVRDWIVSSTDLQ